MKFEQAPWPRSPNVRLPPSWALAGCLKDSPLTGCCERPSNGHNWRLAVTAPS